jgi:DNA-directed RNA polymerase subunit M/transcription elongation factor TFIIS
MKIKTIINQSRRDFTAIYECEHCGNTQQSYGYDDDNFHQNVIPKMKCGKCGKPAPENYRPLKTKYESWEVI